MSYLNPLVLASTALFCGIGFASAVAAPPRPAAFPFHPKDFSDPSEFLERFLGADHAGDERALERIKVSAAEERKLGQRSLRAYLNSLKRQKIRVVDRGKEVRYIRELISTLRPFMSNRDRYRAIRVYLVDSPESDARVLPGGHVFVFRGLLDLVDNEAALIAVLGHELSHLDRGHLLLHVRRLKLTQSTFAKSGSSFSVDRFLQNGAMLMRMWARPFRPEDESEADRDGATWAFRAGYDPRELAKMFLKLQQRDKQQRAPFPAFFRSHPLHQERYADLMKHCNRLLPDRPQPPLYIGKRNLKLRITRSQQEFKE